ncbi:uncharacterized protein LOC127725192 isoform X1 [Mytilus californianus]|uniref:uncharacterized protein LOC127725192 isoform X1 n=1 Tax=Mytilus californianus TaxID=6549 RepID=UPI0022469FC1|nr:uncharacterized protein LOC127725192 isoform X1 [Mytilus californianus]
MSKEASCSSPISESGQPCVQDTNPAAMPAEETDTETFLCLRSTSREKTDTADLGKEITTQVVDNIQRERKLSDKGNPVDQEKGHMCDRQESASSDTSSFVGVGSSVFGSSGYRTECDTCDLLMESPFCEFTKTFWKSIPNLGPDRSQSCHCKFFGKLVQKLKDDFPHEKGLNSKSTINLLKFLLHVEFKDPAAPVLLSNILRLVKLFGPVRKENNGCVLINQLHQLLRRSLKKREQDSNKMSTWFVGEMSRQEADDLLLNDNCKDKTFLIRISGTDGEDGDFALSVRHENHCHHLKIQGNPKKALSEEPYNAQLKFDGQVFKSLTDIIEHIKMGDIQLDDDTEDNPCSSISCLRVYQYSPLNGVMSGYEKTK